MSLQQPFIIFLTWVSGAGKTTMMQQLLSQYDQLEQVLSITTRAPRDGEIDGQDYHFVTLEDFEQQKSDNLFLEYAFVHNSYYYGTRLDWLHEALARWYYPIKNIDPIGMELVEKEWKLDGKYMSIFMDISEELMKERILTRQPHMSDEELQKRLASAQKEREIASRLQHTIVLDATPPKDIVFAELQRLLEL